MSVRALALARGAAVIGGTAALIAGVTLAAFQTNTVTLADNSLSTTNDNLKIFDSVNGYVGSATGVAVQLNPGVESAKQPFYLKNTSGAKLGLSAHLASGAVFTNVTDSTLVTVKFYDDNGHSLASTNLAALQAGQVPLSTVWGFLLPGAEGNGGVAGTNGNFFVTFKIAPSGVDGTSATVTNLDFEFTGTAI